MTPQRTYLVFGLLLLIVGIIFDFGFLAPGVTRAFKGDASAYLGSFGRYIHDLARTYLLVLGVATLALAALPGRSAAAGRVEWAACLMVVIGSVVLIATSFWYAVAGPSFTWETRCTVLSIGLASLLSGLGSEVYRTVARV